MALKKLRIKNIPSAPMFGTDEDGNLYYNSEVAANETILSKHFSLNQIDWKDVQLNFVDYNKIAITIKKRTITFEGYKFGFFKKDGKYRKSGLLLLTLASCHGIGANFDYLLEQLEVKKDALKKLVSRLNKKLMELFVIKERPIFFRGGAYNTRFALKSDYLENITEKKSLDIFESDNVEYNDEIDYD